MVSQVSVSAKGEVYLDNGASTPMDPKVYEAMKGWLLNECGNPSSRHAAGRRAAGALTLARRQIARSFHCALYEGVSSSATATVAGQGTSQPQSNKTTPGKRRRLEESNAVRVVFTSGATEANNLAMIGHALAAAGEMITSPLVSRDSSQKSGNAGESCVANSAGEFEKKLPARKLGKKTNHFGGLSFELSALSAVPHVVLGATEHPSVEAAGKYLERMGFEVERMRLDSQSHQVDLQHLRGILRASTVLVALMCTDNLTGQIFPVEEVASLVRRMSPVARVHVDAVQAVGKLDIDFARLGVDSLALSGHKIHGPKGVGALVVASETALVPLFHGGGQEGGLRPGTENVAGAVALAEAVRLAAMDVEKNVAHMKALRELFLRAIGQVKGLETLHSTRLVPCVSSIIPLLVPEAPAAAYMNYLQTLGVYISAGSACQARLAEVPSSLLARGLDETAARQVIRVSLSRMSTEEEVLAGAAAFAEAVSYFTGASPTGDITETAEERQKETVEVGEQKQRKKEEREGEMSMDTELLDKERSSEEEEEDSSFIVVRASKVEAGSARSKSCDGVDGAKSAVPIATQNTPEVKKEKETNGLYAKIQSHSEKNASARTSDGLSQGDGLDSQNKSSSPAAHSVSKDKAVAKYAEDLLIRCHLCGCRGHAAHLCSLLDGLVRGETRRTKRPPVDGGVKAAEQQVDRAEANSLPGSTSGIRDGSNEQPTAKAVEEAEESQENAGSKASDGGNTKREHAPQEEQCRNFFFRHPCSKRAHGYDWPLPFEERDEETKKLAMPSCRVCEETGDGACGKEGGRSAAQQDEGRLKLIPDDVAEWVRVEKESQKEKARLAKLALTGEGPMGKDGEGDGASLGKKGKKGKKGKHKCKRKDRRGGDKAKAKEKAQEEGAGTGDENEVAEEGRVEVARGQKLQVLRRLVSQSKQFRNEGYQHMVDENLVPAFARRQVQQESGVLNELKDTGGNGDVDDLAASGARSATPGMNSDNSLGLHGREEGGEEDLFDLRHPSVVVVRPGELYLKKGNAEMFLRILFDNIRAMIFDKIPFSIAAPGSGVALLVPKYPRDQRRLPQLCEAVSRVPGVASASVCWFSPVRGSMDEAVLVAKRVLRHSLLQWEDPVGRRRAQAEKVETRKGGGRSKVEDEGSSSDKTGDEGNEKAEEEASVLTMAEEGEAASEQLKKGEEECRIKSRTENKGSAQREETSIRFCIRLRKKDPQWKASWQESLATMAEALLMTPASVFHADLAKDAEETSQRSQVPQQMEQGDCGDKDTSDSLEGQTSECMYKDSQERRQTVCMDMTVEGTGRVCVGAVGLEEKATQSQQEGQLLQNGDSAKKSASRVTKQAATAAEDQVVSKKRENFASLAASKVISEEVSEEVAIVESRRKRLKVDLTSPQLAVRMEVTPYGLFGHAEGLQGGRGLPVGSSGKAICLLSGGIDSPVAAYMMMLRGLKVHYVSFHSYPYLGERSRQKIALLVKQLSKFQPGAKLWIVPFTECQRAIKDKCPEKYRTVLYRRMMQRIASRIAKREGAAALVTGESLGQVASQTLQNMEIIGEASEWPVLRPLVGVDKQDTMNLAKDIGTFDISCLPEPDCCTVFQPKAPVIYGRIEECLDAERKLDMGNLIRRALQGADVEVPSASLHDPEAQAPTSLFCRVCRVFLATRKASAQHYASKTHAEMYRAVAKQEERLRISGKLL